MGDTRPPLRAAFWAICAALLLMLLATLSDPYRVRQSLLAQRRPARPATDVATPSPDADHAVPSDTAPNDPFAPTDGAAKKSDRTLIAVQAADPTSPSASPTDSVPAAIGAQMHVISVGDASSQRHITRPVERSAMPILAPGDLTGPHAGGRFEELPPPPEFETASDLLADVDDAADLSREAERALERLGLETELLALRHELNRSIDLRQIEQIQHLQQQQSALLERQQQTAERLEQLADQLAAHADRLDRSFDERAQVAAPPSAGGRHRLSLVIESDDVAGILERLGRWHPEAALKHAPPGGTRSAVVEPHTRYLAPPPAHSDPTPLSDLQSPTDVLVSPGLAAPAPGPLSSGPLFAPSAICR